MKLILQIILGFASYLIPKSSKIILLGSGQGEDFKGNPKYLYLYLNKESTPFQGIWSADTRSHYNQLEEKGLPVIYRYSLKGFWTILRAKFLIIEKSCSDISYSAQILGRFNYIQTWHGAGVMKKFGAHAEKEGKGIFSGWTSRILFCLRDILGIKSSARFKWILSTTDLVNDDLAKAFENPRIRTLGYPRNDVLFEPFNFEESPLWKELSNFDKIILYAPTFRDSGDLKPFSAEGLVQLNEAMKEKNSIFLLKKHPLDKGIEIPPELSNVKDISSQVKDIQEILIHTDLLITDYSSVIFDFTLKNKPVILYDFDFTSYESSCRGFYYDYHQVLPGPFAKTEKELLDYILSSNVWFLSPEYQKKYATFINQFHDYKDGKSSKRIISYLTNQG